MALSKRADRSVFRAHGFIDLNWKMYVVECGRESDHSCLRKLQSVDLDLQTVKSNSPRFPGTSLQRDRWDSYSDHDVSTFLYEWLCIAPGFHVSSPLFGRHLA